MAEDSDREARPHEVELTLCWALNERGGLTGQVRATNVSARIVRLSSKPVLTALTEDGEPLDARHVVTLEFLPPGYAELAPGEEAVAPVGWAGWAGAAPSGRLIVRWPGGQTELTASGPVQPTSPGPSTNLSSSWFTPTSPGPVHATPLALG